MEREELIRRISGYEWNDIEFKEAQRDVLRNAYETVSAFANTEGGYLVFGARQSSDGFEVASVLSVDKLQGDFLTALQQQGKISVVLDVRAELHRLEKAALLVIYVPETSFGEKPVRLNGDIRLSFVRKGGSDARCSANERDRFLIDAMAQQFDGQAADQDLDNVFDPDGIRWYREIYERRPGNRSSENLSDSDFLDEMDLLVERDGRRRPTHAAILLFGSNAAFRQLLPRPVVDCQRFALTYPEADTGMRWMDRMVLDVNLIRTWWGLADWYQRFAERPFRIDPTSWQRDDTPPDYCAYRESMINLLIHQDYSDHTRKAELCYYADRIVFWNPGNALASTEDLLQPGQKEVRNPRIVAAFRRIGLNESGGWGLWDICCRNWQKLGNVLPEIMNDKGRKHFTLVLLKEELLSERQRIFQARLGVNLTEEQVRAFAFVCRYGEATLPQIKAVTGLSGPDAAAVAERLAIQRLIKPVGASGRYALAEYLRERLGRTDLVTNQPDIAAPNLGTDQVGRPQRNLGTDQVGRPQRNLGTDQVEPLTELSETHWKIVEHCDVPRRLTEIMVVLCVTSRNHFRRCHLNPLICSGIVAMAHPDWPNHPNQAYVLTDAGAAINACRVDGG